MSEEEKFKAWMEKKEKENSSTLTSSSVKDIDLSNFSSKNDPLFQTNFSFLSFKKIKYIFLGIATVSLLANPQNLIRLLGIEKPKVQILNEEFQEEQKDKQIKKIEVKVDSKDISHSRNKEEDTRLSQELTLKYSEDMEEQIKYLDLTKKEDQYYLGIRYANRLEYPDDLDEAIKWLTSAATQGHLEAISRLTSIYYNGEKKDYSKSLFWGELAATQGHIPSQRIVAESYELGRGTEVSIPKALKWYQTAANQGDLYSRRKVEELSLKYKVS